MGADHQRGLAEAMRRASRQRSFFFWLPVSQATPCPAAPAAAQPADQLAEVLLGQDLGRRHQCALPAGVDRDRRGQRGDHGLAAADIALQQRCIGTGRARSAAISSRRRGAGPPSGRRAAPRAVAAPGRRGCGVRGGARRRSRSCLPCVAELLRQQLLGLQALPGRMAAVLQRGERGIGPGVVQEMQRIAQRPRRLRRAVAARSRRPDSRLPPRRHRLAEFGAISPPSTARRR